MDLGLYWQVIRRHRAIAVVGLFVSFALAFVAAFSVSTTGIERRGSAVWEATSTLLVTQPGFPYGRSTLDEFVPAKGFVPDTGAAGSVPRFSDPGRIQYLAGLYAALAYGDDVRFLVRTAVGLPGAPPLDEPKDLTPRYSATPGRAFDGTPLPTVVLAGRGKSEESAIQVSNALTKAVRTVVTRQQNAANIRPDARIVFGVITRADEAKVVEPLRPTRPVMVFLLLLILTVAVVFLVDNLRGRRTADSVPLGEPLVEQPRAAVAQRDMRRGKERLPSIPLTRKEDIEVGPGASQRSSAGRAD